MGDNLPGVKWVDNPEWDLKHPFPVGTRVRHGGELYWEAEQGGTGAIVEVKGPFNDKSYEYLVQRDKPKFDPENKPSWWASYHTRTPLFVAYSDENATQKENNASNSTT